MLAEAVPELKKSVISYGGTYFQFPKLQLQPTTYLLNHFVQILNQFLNEDWKKLLSYHLQFFGTMIKTVFSTKYYSIKNFKLHHLLDMKIAATTAELTFHNSLMCTPLC